MASVSIFAAVLSLFGCGATVKPEDITSVSVGCYSGMNRFSYYSFELAEVDGEVVVYYNDKKTIYENTGIMTENLSADEIAMLKIGYFVEGEEQLFGILENYSS